MHVLLFGVYAGVILIYTYIIYIATSNKCLTSSNKKLLETSAIFVFLFFTNAHRTFHDSPIPLRSGCLGAD